MSWSRVRREAPALATAVRERLDAHTHLTLATLRADGAPRLSGTEVLWHDLGDGEQLWLGAMPGSRKVDDLRRDPRFALHSGSDDPPAWRADAKVAGTAVEAGDEVRAAVAAALPEPPGEWVLLRLELTEAVLTRLGDPADHLVVEAWSAARGCWSVQRR